MAPELLDGASFSPTYAGAVVASILTKTDVAPQVKITPRARVPGPGTPTYALAAVVVGVREDA